MPDLMDDISMPSVPSASPSAPTSQKENQSAENKTAEFTDAATGFGKVYGKDDYKGAPIRFERVLSPDGFGKTFDSGKGEVRIPQGYVPAPDGFGAMYDSDAGKGQKAPGAAPAAVEKSADSDAALKEMFSIKPEQASQKPADEAVKPAESSMAAIDLTKPAENKAVELAKAPQTAEQPKEEKAAAEKAEQPKPAENKAVEPAKAPQTAEQPKEEKAAAEKAEQPKPAENKAVELAKAPQTAEQPKEEKAAAEKAEQPKPVENKAVELAKAPQTTEQSKEEKAAENDAAEANSKRPHKKGKTVKVKARAVHVKAVEAKAEKAIDKADESKPVELAKKPEQPKEMAAIEPSKPEKEAAKPAENKAAEQPKADERKPVELAKKPEQPKEMAAIEPSKPEKEAAKPAENKASEQSKTDEKKPVEPAKKPEQPKEMSAIEPTKAEKEAAKPAENKAAEQPKAAESKPVEPAKKPEQPKEMAAIEPTKAEKDAAKPAENKAEAKAPEIPKAQGSAPQPANTNGVNQPGAIRPPVNAVPPQSPVKPATMNNIPVQPGFGNIPPQNAGNNINGSGMQNAHGGAAFIGSIDDINKYVGNTDAQDHASPVESAETAAPAFTPINRVDSESSGLMDILRDVLAAIVGTLPGFVLWLIFGKLTLGLSAVNLLLNIIMFVCPLVMAAGSLFCYHYVNRDRFIDTKRCALICLAVLAFMIYMANRTVTCLQIVDICNNLKDYMTQITGFIGLSKEDIDSVWDDDMAKEITKEMTGFTKINFGRCFLNFSDILEKMDMNGDFAWSMLKSYLWGFTGGSIGIKLAKKYNLL